MIAAAVALASCQPGPPKDCSATDQEVRRCLERYSGKRDRELLESCFPFSQPQRIAGAWVSGFETNEFYEGEQATLDLINSKVGDTELQMDGVARAGPNPFVSQIEFIGRRSQCHMGLPRHIIIVDRVLSKHDQTGS